MPHDFDAIAKKVAESKSKGKDVSISDLIGDIDMEKLQKDTETLMDLPEQIINAFEAIKLLNQELITANALISANQVNIRANQENIRSLNKSINLMKENALLNRKG